MNCFLPKVLRARVRTGHSNYSSVSCNIFIFFLYELFSSFRWNSDNVMGTLKLKRQKLLIYELGKFWWKKLWATYSKLTKHNRHIIFNGVEILGNTPVLLKKTKSPFTFCWFVKCDEKKNYLFLILLSFYFFYCQSSTTEVK